MQQVIRATLAIDAIELFGSHDYRKNNLELYKI